MIMYKELRFYLTQIILFHKEILFSYKFIILLPLYSTQFYIIYFKLLFNNFYFHHVVNNNGPQAFEYAYFYRE